MDRVSVRVLLVDDFEPWQRFAATTLRNQPELEIVGNVSDGLEAVQKAQELQPDLILLDIGLPTLNGIEAARRIGELSPKSKILFVSENRSWDIAEEALRSGGNGYVVKSNAESELLPAVAAVLQGKPFVSSEVTAEDLVGKFRVDMDRPMPVDLPEEEQYDASCTTPSSLTVTTP
jgi:DNA-binding NarL/FixJ family response regulator